MWEAKAMSTGFKVPMQIPGAPERVTINQLISDGVALFRTSLDILQRKPGVYEAEVNQATWWRFWLIVGTGSVIIAIANAISTAILDARFAAVFGASFRPGIVGIIIALILGIPFAAIALYAAAYVSQQYASQQSSEAVPLVKHAYTVALVVMPANVIASLVTLVLGFLAFGLGALISLVVSIYALFVTVDGIQMLYKFDRNKAWITAAIMIVTSIVVTLVLGAIIGAII
jgi:hypothetical protein